MKVIMYFSRSFTTVRSRLLDVNVQERLSRLGTVAILVLLPVWVWWNEQRHALGQYPAEAKVFNLTGIGSEGTWTLEGVRGYNYWWKSFSPAAIEVDEGDLVVLRIKSSDVTHIFYAPTLNIGPVYVEAGHVEVVNFRVEKQGVHEYYCMSVCGDCHFFMRGKIIVGDRIDATLAVSSDQSSSLCVHKPRGVVGSGFPGSLKGSLDGKFGWGGRGAAAGSNLEDIGRYLFQRMACVACHGEGGKGGVSNPNYVRGTVPALSSLGETMSLADREACEEFIKMVEEGKDVDQIAEMETGIPRQSLVLAKYRIVRDVIAKGRPALRADSTSFEPPLSMPQWSLRLSERDIDALIVYLLKQQSWEEDEQ